MRPCAAPGLVNAGAQSLPLGAWLLFLVCFAPVLSWLVQIWSTSIYDAHGALVPPLFAIMLLAQRRQLAELPASTSWTGFTVLAAGCLLGVLAAAMDIHLLAGCALILSALGLCWCLWGGVILRRLAMPLAFLVLMLPLNYPLEIFAGFPLRMLATRLTVGMLHLVGVDASHTGTLITTTHFQVFIDAPCSGLKTLAALLMTGIVLAHFLLFSWRQRGLLLAAIPLVAVAANALRNLTIVLLGHNFGREAAMGFMHTFSGLLSFLLAVAALIGGCELLRWHARKRQGDTPAKAAPAAAAQTRIQATPQTAPLRTNQWLYTLLAVLLLTTAGVNVWLASRSLQYRSSVGFDKLPVRLLGQAGEELAPTDRETSLLQQDGGRILQRRFGSGTNILWLVAVQSSSNWRVQHPPQVCYTAQGWRITEAARQQVAITGMPAKPVMRLLVSRDGKHRVVYYFYTDGACWTPSYFQRIGQAVLDRLLRAQIKSWVMVQISAPWQSAADEARLCRAVAEIHATLEGRTP